MQTQTRPLLPTMTQDGGKKKRFSFIRSRGTASNNASLRPDRGSKSPVQQQRPRPTIRGQRVEKD
eukprot:8078046-Pyramimonas_sp.AAC.1